MLLSDRYKFLFVHIAKTGGTSVRAALQSLRWRDPWYYPMFLCSRISHLSGHRLACKLPRHAAAIAAREMLPQPYFEALFKFAFVRNPWDLQVSSYHHLRRERPALIAHCTDFESFLRWKLDPQRSYQYHIDTSIRLQSEYLVDHDGNMIVDYVGRYERLQEDFHRVCQELQLSVGTLPHRRRARNRKHDYRHYYSSATTDLVARRFAADIARFAYSFEDIE